MEKTVLKSRLRNTHTHTHTVRVRVREREREREIVAPRESLCRQIKKETQNMERLESCWGIMNY